jgi:hypothetical protein
VEYLSASLYINFVYASTETTGGEDSFHPERSIDTFSPAIATRSVLETRRNPDYSPTARALTA